MEEKSYVPRHKRTCWLCCIRRPGVRLTDAEAPVHVRRQQQPPGARRQDTEHLVTAAGARPAGAVRGATCDTPHGFPQTRQFLFMMFQPTKRRLSVAFRRARKFKFLRSLNEFLVEANLTLCPLDVDIPSLHRYPRKSDY